MAPRSSTKLDSKAIEPEKTEEEIVYQTNRVQLLAPLKVIVRAETTVSGNAYEWAGCGAIVEVDERDVPGIFRLRSGFQPCASCHDGDSMMFMILD